MLVWKITGDEIGPNGNGAHYFAKKSEAVRALADFHTTHPCRQGEGPFPVRVGNRREIVEALNDAMGYGAS